MSPPNEKKGVGSPQELIPDEDRAGKQAPFVSEDYNKVARSAKLKAIMLTSSGFLLKPAFFGARREEGNLQYLYNAKLCNETYDTNEGNASCVWEWGVEAKVARTKVLSIKATYLIIYSGIVGCNEEAVKRYLRRVGRFATYPYFRAHVSQLSWESSANIPLLPAIAS